MRHSPLARALAALLALWFAALVGEPVALHACPVHGVHAEHAAADAHAATGGHEHRGGRSSRACSCLGDCDGCPPGVPAPGARGVAVAASAPAGPVATAPRTGRPLDAIRLLPFATGPPRLLRA